MLFIAGCNSWFGQAAVAKGQGYYRKTKAIKAALERALNLGEYAIVTTPGMKRDHDVAPAGTPETAAHRLGKITQQIRVLLAIIGALAFIGAVRAA